MSESFQKVAGDKMRNKIEDSINELRNKLRKKHLKSVEKEEYNYLTGIIYSDLFSECEKPGDYLINITEAVADIKET